MDLPSSLSCASLSPCPGELGATLAATPRDTSCCRRRSFTDTYGVNSPSLSELEGGGEGSRRYLAEVHGHDQVQDKEGGLTFLLAEHQTWWEFSCNTHSSWRFRVI